MRRSLYVYIVGNLVRIRRIVDRQEDCVRSCADAPVRTEPPVGNCDSPLIVLLISDPYLVLADLLRFLRLFPCTDADPNVPDT